MSIFFTDSVKRLRRTNVKEIHPFANEKTDKVLKRRSRVLTKNKNCQKGKTLKELVKNRLIPW